MHVFFAAVVGRCLLLCALHESVNVSHDSEKIEAAIKKALYDKGYRSMVENCSNPYGDGNSSKKIAEILHSLTIDDKLLTKDITY